jgi:hypothetical protein
MVNYNIKKLLCQANASEIAANVHVHFRTALLEHLARLGCVRGREAGKRCRDRFFERPLPANGELGIERSIRQTAVQTLEQSLHCSVVESKHRRRLQAAPRPRALHGTDDPRRIVRPIVAQCGFRCGKLRAEEHCRPAASFRECLARIAKGIFRFAAGDCR